MRSREDPALLAEKVLVNLARYSKDQNMKRCAIEAVAHRPDKDINEQIDRIVGNDKDDIAEFFGCQYQNTKWKQLCSIRRQNTNDIMIDQVKSTGNIKSKWHKKLNDKISSINIDSHVMSNSGQEELKSIGKLRILNPIKVVPPIKPLKVPDVLSKDKVNIQDSMLINSSILYCYTCWGVVPVGFECVKCKLCPIVSHRDCVIDSDNFISNDDIEPEHHVHSTIEWTCPFCLADIHSENSHNRRKYDRQYESYLQYISAIKIQHFMKMAPKVVSYRKAKIVVTKIQRKFRVKMFWKQKEKDSNNKKVPLRIRLHKIELFVKNNNYVPSELNKRLDPPVPPLKKIGEIVSSVYDVQFGNSMEYTAPVDYSEESDGMGIYNMELLTFLSSKVMQECGTLASDQASIIDYLKDGHIYAPEYATTFRSLTTPPAGTIFLTVTVFDKDIQVFRIDLPLKFVGKKKLTMEHLQRLNVPDDPEIYDFPELLKAYEIGTFTTNPYILIPGCTTSCKINMIISQVSRWPKLNAAGCSKSNMSSFLLFKKSVTHSQGLAVADYDDLPITDPGCKMQINLPVIDRKRNDKVFACARPKNSGDHNEHNEKKKKDDTNLLHVNGGAIQWTMLAFSTIDANEYGYVNILNAPTINSAKRRFLFILIDKVITYYTTNLLANYTIDLRACSVYLLDDFIIKIKGPIESWYLMDSSTKDTINWFRKMYICCKDNLTKKFNESMVNVVKSLDGNP